MDTNKQGPLERSSENPFHNEPDKPGFEMMARQNGFLFWWASDLASLLGYDHISKLTKAINKAMTVLQGIGIPIVDNIVQERREVNGEIVLDYKLSRFACYLTAMNGDVKNPTVQLAQAYFVTFAEVCRVSIENAGAVDRVSIRTEIASHETTLSGVAKAAGVENYAFFQNAGYRGLYNCNLSEIRRIKGVPENRSALDFMGRAELAANLFRVTQTEQKILRENIKGQKPLETAAHSVGVEVRNSMKRMGNTMPENLPAAGDIKEVQKNLKSTQKEFKKLDFRQSAE